MSIKLNYSKKSANKISSNLVLFCDEKYKTTGLKKYVFDNEFSYINDLIKTIDIKNNLYVFEVNSKKKIVLVSIKNSLKTSDIEMTPDTQTTIGLDELNKVIAEQKGVAVKDLAVGGSSVEEVASATTVPSGEASATVDAAKEQPLTDEQLAKNMRADADRMFKEAERLRKEAEDLSPTKKGKSSDKA